MRTRPLALALVSILSTFAAACAPEAAAEDPDTAEGALGEPKVVTAPASRTSLAHRAGEGTSCPRQAVGFYTPLDPKDPFGKGVGCSGVLIAKNKLLTANHCGLKPGVSFYWFAGDDPGKPGMMRTNIKSFESVGWFVDAAIVTLSSDVTDVTPAATGKDPGKNAKSGLKAAGFSGGIGCHAEDVGGYQKNVSWAQALFIPTVTGPKMRGGDSGGPVYTQDAKGNITVFGVDKGELEVDKKNYDVFTEYAP